MRINDSAVTYKFKIAIWSISETGIVITETKEKTC
jgi:hypothetical protein